MKDIMKALIVRAAIALLAMGILHLITGDVYVFAASDPGPLQSCQIDMEEDDLFEELTDSMEDPIDSEGSMEDPIDNEGSWIDRVLEGIEQMFEADDSGTGKHYYEPGVDIDWDDIVLLWTVVYGIIHEEKKEDIQIFYDNNTVVIQVELDQTA